jgi:hypothetical protein
LVAVAGGGVAEPHVRPGVVGGESHLAVAVVVGHGEAAVPAHVDDGPQVAVADGFAPVSAECAVVPLKDPARHLTPRRRISKPFARRHAGRARTHWRSLSPTHPHLAPFEVTEPRIAGWVSRCSIPAELLRANHAVEAGMCVVVSERGCSLDEAGAACRRVECLPIGTGGRRPDCRCHVRAPRARWPEPVGVPSR